MSERTRTAKTFKKTRQRKTKKARHAMAAAKATRTPKRKDLRRRDSPMVDPPEPDTIDTERVDESVDVEDIDDAYHGDPITDED